jgi:lipopolysaccharide assembly outer membrane protein LptD (OstA)
MNLFSIARLSKIVIIPFIVAFLYGPFSGDLMAQKPLNPIKDTGPKSMIELIRADSLVGDNSQLKSQTFMGNVIFRHRGVLLGCSKAVHNLSSNFIEAYGKIVINQGDTLTIVGDTLLYDGNTRQAIVQGKSVILRDKKITLRTTKINYDLNRSQAYYPVYGSIVQDSSKLSSAAGYYNTNTKFFQYVGDVEILNPSYTLCTDSLDYDTYTKQAFFKTFTTLKSKDGDLSAYKGKYNLKTKQSFFQGRAKVTNVSYSLEADTLSFDNTSTSGKAVGNVVFISFVDSLKIIGNKGLRMGETGITKIMGETVTERISGADTLYIAADTLWVFEKKEQILSPSKTDETKPVVNSKSNSTQKPDPSKPLSANKNPKKKEAEKIIADGKVKIFRKDFQSISDSLLYNLKDSMIYFFQKPILWSTDNQLEADTIHISLKNNKLHLLKLLQNSFVIASDTIRNFNQIKGRKIDAIFAENGLMKTIKVEGNGESIYFALDEKNKIIGLNKVQCSSMQFNFAKKKIKQIVFKGEPESMLIPPREILNEDLKLEHFEWKIAIKPTLNQVLGPKFNNLVHTKKTN